MFNTQDIYLNFNLIRFALKRKLMRSHDLEEIDVLVVSPGGVGTTFLLSHLSGFLRTNDIYDRDGLKHLPSPPRKGALTKNIKMIFISGDVDEIVASISRRGWLNLQSAKLGCIRGVVYSETRAKQQYSRALEKQIRKWTKLKDKNLLLIDYDDIWDRAEEIARHVNIDQAEFVQSFPERRSRSIIRKSEMISDNFADCD